MKRALTIIAAVALAAVTSQAKIINWGSDGAVSYLGTAQGDADAYLMFGKATATPGIYDFVTLDYRTTAPGPFGTGNLAPGSGPTQTIGYGDEIGTTGLFANNGQDGFFVRFYNTAGTHFIDSSMFVFTGTDASLMDIQAPALFGSTNPTSPNASNQMSTAGWSAVPEPSTLVLGIVGLSAFLRRRFTKKK